MTTTTIPRITGAAPAGLLLAPEGRGALPVAEASATSGTSWVAARVAPPVPAHSPAPHVARPEPAPVDEAVWVGLERMLAERERCRRAHPAFRRR